MKQKKMIDMKKISRYLIFSIVAMILLSCKRDDEMIGPELGNFSIVEPLQANRINVDFSTGETVEFSAKLSNKVNWVLQLKGQSTNITKTYTGIGNKIDGANVTWIGDADHPEFKIENVIAVLKFPDYPNDSSILNITINGVKDISSQGILVNDFESGINGFTTYGEPGEIIVNTIVSDPLIGGKYYNVTGRDVNGNFFIGLGGFPANVKYFPAIHFPIPNVALDQAYFNCYIYGTGDSTTQVSFDFQEDDAGDANPGSYIDAGDDTWSKGFLVDWKGWKLVSFKMSETARSTQAAFGGSGNGIQEINRILKVQVVLLAINNNSTPVKAIIDYPIFTTGAPFSY